MNLSFKIWTWKVAYYRGDLDFYSAIRLHVFIEQIINR